MCELPVGKNEEDGYLQTGLIDEFPNTSQLGSYTLESIIEWPGSFGEMLFRIIVSLLLSRQPKYYIVW